MLLGFRTRKPPVLCITELPLLFQGPAQAQNLRDSIAQVKSDIVVKVLLSCTVFSVLIHRTFFCSTLVCKSPC
jgi:hypothetical protein